MATCPFCKGFMDDTYKCSCYGEWQREVEAGHYPEGLVALGAFEYEVWRKVRSIEYGLQLHPELGEAWSQERLAKIFAEANANYQKNQEYIAEQERAKARLASIPRPRLY